ncbi:MAG TPA: hypothetical protein VK152_00120 [Paludibacter sp.]|nr:hypothetical protein [Paludibacter sp.]
MKNLLYLVLMFLVTSCGSTIVFPVSDIEPAAEINARIKKDKQNNYVISLSANYLASPDRLVPAKKVYVAWLVSKESGTNNIGQLMIKNAKKATLEILTPFEPAELFITAEDEGNISTPEGVEITHVYLNAKDIDNK